jgi:osmoprotectant transport system substrate-binding protein
MKNKIFYLIVLLLTGMLLFGTFGCAGTPDAVDESAGDEAAEGSDEEAVIDGPPVVVSSKIFTESQILGEMLIMLLEHYGFPTGNEIGLGATNILRPALIAGDIDLYYEYTGTVLITQMQAEAIFDPAEAYETVKAWDLETNDVVWLDMAPANNTDIMLARPGFNTEFGISTISELVEVINEGTSPKLKVAIRDEWYERADGWGRLKGNYGLNEDNIEVIFIGMGLEYDALRTSEVDISFGFATDGRIAAFDLDVIEDDLSNFAVYNPAPTIRKETLDLYPDLAGIINPVTALLTNETLRDLNQQVDVGGKSIDQVASEFLTANGFID